ncbi:MAG TPA: sn-glycerol-1-phosphate dehydrogenase [Casimicrobiaceae bacterium]|jgi:glycerol-1-phosphate dehydrogenase [NAD(P)+]
MRESETVLEHAVRSASVTRSVVVDPDAITRLPHVLRSLGYTGACQLVADPDTMAAAGNRVLTVLRSAGIATEEPIALAEIPRLKPRAETARDVGARLKAKRALPIAVGAGVINDVTKYAAHVAGLPYVSVPTAASMDGYAASGAAMLEGGFKRTLACAPPIAIVADIDVIAKAPARMAPWGYGDLAGKVVAGADWILADAVGEESLDPTAFALVQDNVKVWLSGSDRIAAHDIEALRGLMNGLLISGFAMQAHGNSRPASGSEHQLSHVWEMDRLTVDGEPAAHGACVGVGAVAILALYEWFLAQDVPTAINHGDWDDVFDHRVIEAEVQASFPEPFLVESARTEMAAKLARSGARASRLRALGAAWPALRERIESTLIPAVTMEQWLSRCGAASHPAEFGVPLSKLAADYRRARLIRRRYTILDCLEDLGWLDKAIEALFESGGFWGRRSRPLEIAAVIKAS